MIVDSYIDNYIGEWKNKRGDRLNIKKVDDKTAPETLKPSVSFPEAIWENPPIYSQPFYDGCIDS